MVGYYIQERRERSRRRKGRRKIEYNETFTSRMYEEEEKEEGNNERTRERLQVYKARKINPSTSKPGQLSSPHGMPLKKQAQVRIKGRYNYLM